MKNLVLGKTERTIKRGNFQRYKMRKKVLLRGPLLTQSGYGHHARTVLRSLRTKEDVFDIYLQSTNWGSTSWLWKDDEERKWIDRKLQKTMAHVHSGEQFDFSIQVTIPSEWEKLAPINIGVTAGIETTKLSPQWLQKCEVVDKIITISDHAKRIFDQTSYVASNPETKESAELKCKTDIDVVHYPVLAVEPEKLDLDLTTDFNFLSVVQISPRKNLPQLIKNFVESFKDNENVGLILKLNTSKNSKIDRVNTIMRLKSLLAPYRDRNCKIYLLHGYLSDAQMSGLYNHPKVKAYVTTTHGEGFGLPIFESSYYGLPVIAPDWSGHVDFLHVPTTVKKNNKRKMTMKSMFSKVDYTLRQVEKEAVWEGVIQADSMWAYPDDSSLKKNMLEMQKDYGRFKKRASTLKKWVVENFSAEEQYSKYVESILSTPGLNVEEEINDLFDKIQASGS
jgi:glycosyltransferase involved in cell wall biosynthesis